jgi:cellulose synthase/poly-beta-1,6-N-acetylglucosamine synthase-like glycosyltransferase
MWSLSLFLLALSAFLVTGAFCTVTLPYLFYGSFYSRLLGLHVTATTAFIALFAFRYWRLVVHLASYLRYKPNPYLRGRGPTNKNVTVILPTIEPSGHVFYRCIASICRQQPAAFYIVVGHNHLVETAEESVAGLRLRYPNIKIQCHSSRIPGKRIQIAEVLDRIQTSITILADDHVYWPQSFLPAILAPFAEPQVALVGTSKRVIMECHASCWAAFWNFLGAIYLERHNFEIAATTRIDGGIFAVSGRTCAVRSDIMADEDFQTAYLHETIGILGRTWGPLGADDNNFLTRHVMALGLEIRVQCAPEATIHTPLGEFPKFLHTCLRWARTTFRSNPRALLLPAGK